MGALTGILTGISPAPRRVMIYGFEGIGKSTLASKAPRPVFIDLENGLGSIDCERFARAETFDQFSKDVRQVLSDDHDYKTLVIDSADWLERLIFAQVCRKTGKKSVADVSYGRGYDMAADEWERTLRLFDDIRDKRGMVIVLLAHSKIEKFDNPEGENYDRYAPALHRKTAPLVQQWCDEILFASYKVRLKDSDESFGKKKVKAKGDGTRILYTSERPFRAAKNRLNLPAELPMEWEAYAKYIPAPAEAKQSKPIVQKDEDTEKGLSPLPESHGEAVERIHAAFVKSGSSLDAAIDWQVENSKIMPDDVLVDIAEGYTPSQFKLVALKELGKMFGIDNGGWNEILVKRGVDTIDSLTEPQIDELIEKLTDRISSQAALDAFIARWPLLGGSIVPFAANK